MAEPLPNPPDPEEPPGIADATWLAGAACPPAPSSSGPAAGPGDGYDLIDPVPPASEAPDSPAPTRPIPTRRSDRAPDPSPRADAPAARREVQVWTRWAEWWPTILALSAVALTTGVLAYASFDLAYLAPAMTVLILGGLIGLVLSYPIVITLERPVRITPEQAVKDYFASLSHHRPHYRRMWLLLSPEGRVCGEYASFEGFQSYWRRTQAELRGSRVSSWTPLVFAVEDFASERSVGLLEVEARYTLHVLARGRRHEGPLATFACRTTLVRGPDRMWYLDRGTLPRADS